MPRKITPQAPSGPSMVPTFIFLLLPLPLLLLTWSLACAATWYVKPSAEVPVRSGQGTEFKILAVVPDGMAVELLQEADPWARIRTPGGTEGWLLKRYLSNAPTPGNVVASLQKEKSRLEEENRELGRKAGELSRTHGQSSEELAACRAERDEARQNLETLRRETADVITIKNNNTEMAKELLTLRGQLATVEQERKGLKRNTSLIWFLAGALVMLCGWFLGSLSGKNRKRKTTLY